MTRVSCPYCNTGFSLPEVPPDGRTVCPRCGDAFRVKPADGEPPASTPGGGTPGADAPGSPGSGRRRSWVLPLLIALALPGIGIGVGLLYLRGGSKSKPPEPESPPSTAVTAPLALRGLGYLPPNANLVFAVQPGPLLAYAARTHQDPRRVLTKAGVPAGVFATLDRAGLPVEEIDHLAGGLFVPDTDLSQLRAAVAVVLRKPLPAEDQFLGQLKAKRVERAGQARYEVEVAGLPLKLARAADTVWVFGWSEKDLPAIAGGESFSTGMREVIAGQVPADAAGWVAAAPERWTEKKPVAFLLQGTGWTPDRIAVLAKGRAAAVGVTLRDELRLSVAVRCADTETAEKLRAYFKEKVTAPGAITDGNGEWARFDTPTEPQAGYQTVKDFLRDAGQR